MRNLQEPFHYSTSTGTRTIYQEGFIPGLGYAKFDPDGVANVLSVSSLKRHGFSVQYELIEERHGLNDDRFIVTDQGTAKTIFSEIQGLYIFPLTLCRERRLALQEKLETYTSRINAEEYLSADQAYNERDERLTGFAGCDPDDMPAEGDEEPLTLADLESHCGEIENEIQMLERNIFDVSPTLSLPQPGEQVLSSAERGGGASSIRP